MKYLMFLTITNSLKDLLFLTQVVHIMCLNDEWFDTYTTCDISYVIMGKNSLLKLVGIST